MILSSPIKDRYLHEWFSQPIVANPEISSCSDTNLVDMSNIYLLCSQWIDNCPSNSFPWIQLIPLLQSWTFSKSDNVSPSSVTFEIRSVFFALDHSPGSRMILIPLTIPILFHRFQWQIVEVLPLLEKWYQVAPLCHEVFLRSLRIARFRREEFPRDQDELFVSFSKKFNQVAPIARTSQYHFPLLRRPSTVVITLWITCWREAFHELLMVMMIGGFEHICAFIRSHRSFLFLSIWFPGILTPVTSLHRAYWSRGRYVRRRPGNKSHYRSRFCCDSFSSWILLRSFRQCIRAHCRTEMADIEQIQQMIPLISCEISFD